MPLVAFAMQSNSDATPVATRHQAEMYCCKYCSKYTKGKGHKCALYEIIDEMERRDAIGQEKNPQDYEDTRLGSKLHRAFMAEIGVEMCQAEVAHHINRSPEYFISREIKRVHIYKQLLPINQKANKRVAQENEEPEWDEGWDEDEGKGDEQRQDQSVTTKLSDAELYERRLEFKVWPAQTSEHLPPRDTAEEQLETINLFDFYRLLKYKGGKYPHLQWREPQDWPIVVMSPVVKLTEGASFGFAARWALLQYHHWSNRKQFLDMDEDEVKDFFRKWRAGSQCPRYIKQQYLEDNGRRARGGAGPMGRTNKQEENQNAKVALDPQVYKEKIATLLQAEDYAGAAMLQKRQSEARKPSTHDLSPEEFEAKIAAMSL